MVSHRQPSRIGPPPAKARVPHSVPSPPGATSLRAHGARPDWTMACLHAQRTDALTVPRFRVWRTHSLQPGALSLQLAGAVMVMLVLFIMAYCLLLRSAKTAAAASDHESDDGESANRPAQAMHQHPCLPSLISTPAFSNPTAGDPAQQQNHALSIESGTTAMAMAARHSNQANVNKRLGPLFNILGGYIQVMGQMGFVLSLVCGWRANLGP